VYNILVTFHVSNPLNSLYYVFLQLQGSRQASNVSKGFSTYEAANVTVKAIRHRLVERLCIVVY